VKLDFHPHLLPGSSSFRPPHLLSIYSNRPYAFFRRSSLRDSWPRFQCLIKFTALSVALGLFPLAVCLCESELWKTDFMEQSASILYLFPDQRCCV